MKLISRLKHTIYLAGVVCLLFSSVKNLSAHEGKHGSETMSHEGHHGSSSSQTITQPTISLTIHSIMPQKDKKLVHIKLTQLKDGNPVTLDDLKEVHTEKIHLLIIDRNLEDYHHIHPKPTETPGMYEFEWMPQKNANYKIWADLVPIATQTQEYVNANLLKASNNVGRTKKEISYKSSIDDIEAELSFETFSLLAGKASMGKVVLKYKNGGPVKDLEPLMGAFAHIVGFSEDGKSVIHVHPMGDEPQQDTDRGGPELQFHIVPEKEGFIKLFVQAKIKGKELYFPFGIETIPAK